MMLTLFGELRALAQCVSRYTVDTNPHSLMASISKCFPFTLIAHISRLYVLLATCVHICWPKTYSEGDVLWPMHGSLFCTPLQHLIETACELSLLSLHQWSIS
jgi:hypothetical protein